eukprot:3386306-Amphidinium_carterae.1
MKPQGKTSVYNPLISTMVGAVVFADASGFTAMTEQLAKHVKGGEKIGACLNDFFGPLITIIHSYGGDILKFSGAKWASQTPPQDIFPVDNNHSSAPTECTAHSGLASSRIL